MKDRAVVFDLWDTLALWPVEAGLSLNTRMAEHLGIDRDRFHETWTAARDDRETGPLVVNVRAVCEQLGVGSERVEQLTAMRHEHTREVLVARPGAVEVLDALRDRGYLLGLISNCAEDVVDAWGETVLAGYFDSPVFSCSAGLRKPDPRIYELAAESLGVRPGECLFVDDRPTFVQGAVAAGMDAVLLRYPEGSPAPAGLESWDGPRIDRLEQVLSLVD